MKKKQGFKPVNKYIVITQIKEELKTASGLLMSAEDSAGFRYKKGLVIEIGENVGVMNVGDTIYYDSGSGHDMLIEDNPYTIIKEQNVVIVL